MKMPKERFEKMVKDVRKTVPSFVNGRKVVILSEYSKRGQEVLNMGSRYEGTELYQVYEHCSPEKRKAFAEAYQMFVNDEDSNSFSICSHSCHFFTVSWLNKLGLVFLTHKTAYLVVIND